MRRLATFLIVLLPTALLAGPPVIDEGFEDAIPEFHTYRADYAADTAQAHTGVRSLRVTPKDGPTGGAYFRLDGVIDTGRDYVFTRPPLRFIVLDASYWRTSDGGFTETYERGKTGGIGLKPEQIEWLRRSLTADTATPTVVVWHYAMYNRGGVSSCGYKLPACRDKQILDILEAAPNVIATLNGHKHWNSVDRIGGITCVQNAAFVEWPNMYRVFRVYGDRLEWDVRLADSFGFVRESFVPEKAVSWMISTQSGDLAGTIPLRRREER